MMGGSGLHLQAGIEGRGGELEVLKNYIQSLKYIFWSGWEREGLHLGAGIEG